MPEDDLSKEHKKQIVAELTSAPQGVRDSDMPPSPPSPTGTVGTGTARQRGCVL